MRRGIIILTLLALFAVASSAVLAQNEVVHVVQPGENLFRISLKYNVSITAIAQRNGITNVNLIFVGQSLVIPGTTGGTGNPPPQPTTPPQSNVGTYTVVGGDTLSRIAARFGTTWQAIASLNNIANPNLIFAGQVLQ